MLSIVSFKINAENLQTDTVLLGKVSTLVIGPKSLAEFWQKLALAAPEGLKVTFTSS